MRALLVVSAVLCLSVALGCGGGGSSNSRGGTIATGWPISGQDWLDSGDFVSGDGSYGDYVNFTAPHSGYVTATMTAIDPMEPWVSAWTGYNGSGQRVAYDQDDSYGITSQCGFWVDAGQKYSVLMTTYGSGAVKGRYSYAIVDSPTGTTSQGTGKVDPVK